MLRLFSFELRCLHTVIAVCPVLIRPVKSSFTMRVDQMFTTSREPTFTNATDRPVKTPVIA
jgi:hypothetical protein